MLISALFNISRHVLAQYTSLLYDDRSRVIKIKHALAGLTHFKIIYSNKFGVLHIKLHKGKKSETW